jgi:outer membrane protein
MLHHSNTILTQSLTRNLRFFLLCCACIFMPPFSASAADPPPDPAQEELSIGISGNVSTTPYKNYDTQWMPWPVINYEGKHAYVRGFNAGVKIINLPFLEFSAYLGYDDTRFDSADTSNKALRLLKDRNPSAIAGLETRLLSPYGMLHVSGAGDILGQSNGLSGSVGYMLPLEYGPVEFIPAAGVHWSDDKYNDYYYGISANEARKSGLDEYKGEFGFSPYLGLTLDYSITDKWGIFCQGELVFLNNAIRNSPMVGKDRTQSLTLGTTYNF